MLRAGLRLRDIGITHGALGGDTIIVSGRGTCIRDFRRASPSAPAGQLDDDMAAVLGAMAVRAGVEVPKLAEAKRVSWASLLFAVGSLIGIWLIIGVLSDAGDSLAAIKGASWGWVALTFIFARLPMVVEAWALLGAVVGDLPFGRCVALETSNSFTALVGGDVAVFALRVRFFQRQGHDAEAAVSAGAVATTASWTVKTLLFLIAIPFAAGSFHAPSSSGGSQNAVWIILVVILAAGIADTLVALVPRLRRLVSSKQRFCTAYLPPVWGFLTLTWMRRREYV
jgi:hypothetical protein